MCIRDRHQAIEAKEHVKVERENKTLATITYQNYFRMYKKLSGMTGTAKTEEEEFNGIYNLDVVCIPTNKPMIRKDCLLYTSRRRITACILQWPKRDGPRPHGAKFTGSGWWAARSWYMILIILSLSS